MSETGYITWDEIVLADDVTEDDVPVPEWGTGKKVRVHGLSLEDQHWMRRAARDEDGNIDSDKMELLMIVRGVKQPALDLAALEILHKKAIGPVNRILRRIMELSEMTEGAVGKAEDAFHSGSEPGV